MFDKLSNISIKYGYSDLAELLKIAGKVDSLKEQFPHYVEQVDILAAADPSPTKKYVEWAVKQLINGINILKLTDIIKDFHRLHQKLQNKDINQYTYDQLNTALEPLQNTTSKRQQKQQIKTEGADRLYESEKFVVLYIKNLAASCVYGDQTNWCISRQNNPHFEEYTNEGIVFYFIINKLADNSDPMRKIAVGCVNGKAVAELYDANDNMINMDSIKDELGEEYSKIWSSIEGHAGTTGLQDATKVLENIARNGTLKQRKELATSDDLPRSVLEILVQDKSPIVRVFSSNAKSFPEDLLMRLLNDKNEKVVAHILINPNVPQDILVQMAKSKNIFYRAGVARNEKTPSNILIDLSNDKNESVRIEANTNPGMPSEALSKIYDKNKNNRKVLYDLAFNKSTPYDVLIKILWNPNSNFDVLEMLVKAHDDNDALMNKMMEQKQNTDFRLLVAHYSTNVAILRRAATDSSLAVRINLVTNNNVPDDLLRRLMKDPELEVRRAVIKSYPPKDVLEYLANNDSNANNRIAAKKILSEHFEQIEATTIFNSLIKLANKLDQHLYLKIANQIDLIIKANLPQQQINNDYFQIGYKKPEPEQEEVMEESNEEMEAKDMEGITEGKDNLVIDKNSNPGDKF